MGEKGRRTAVSGKWKSDRLAKENHLDNRTKYYQLAKIPASELETVGLFGFPIVKDRFVNLVATIYKMQLLPMPQCLPLLSCAASS